MPAKQSTVHVADKPDITNVGDGSSVEAALRQMLRAICSASCQPSDVRSAGREQTGEFSNAQGQVQKETRRQQ
jgi:hypothetical protein